MTFINKIIECPWWNSLDMERREKLHKNATKCNGYTLEGSCGNRVVGER